MDQPERHLLPAILSSNTMNGHSTIEGLRVIVSSHRYIYGPGEALVDFLQSNHVKDLFVCFHSIPSVDITWPMSDLTSLSEYRNGKLIYERIIRTYGPSSIKYISQLAITFFLSVSRKKRFDIAVGEGLLDTLACIALRRFGVAGTVVFHSHSFQPGMPNGFGRRVYFALYRLCARQSDHIWSLSDRLTRVNSSLSEDSQKCSTVPIGIDTRYLKVREVHQPNGVLVFVGHLKEDNGVRLIVRAMIELKERHPDSKLLLIGGGPMDSWLRKFVTEARLGNVSILGPLPYPEVMRILSWCDIGVAMYKPSSGSITLITDPMKIKMYLAAGLPIISTQTHWISSEILSSRAGEIIGYNEEHFVSAVSKILNDYETYHNNAVELASRYGSWSWEMIFGKAIKKLGK